MFELFRELEGRERRAAFAGLGTLFGLMAGHLVLETARDAIFLSNISPTQLPLLYLAIAGLALVLTQLQKRFGDGLPVHRTLIGWLIGSVTATVLLWLFLDPLGRAGIYLLYLVPGVVSTVALVQFWVLLGNVLTMDDAKRLYVVIGAGGGLGAIAGSAAATVLSKLVSDPTILLGAATCWATAPFGVAVMARALPDEKSVGDDQTPNRRLLESVRRFFEDRYTRRVLALMLLLPMVSTFADYLFKSVAAEQIAPESMATFFGSVYFVLNSLSLSIQLGVVRTTLRKFELATLLSVLPLAMAGGGLAAAAGAVFVAGIGMKVADGSLRHSLHETASELLYVPLSEAARSRLKSVSMVFGKRGGQALASLALLGLVEAGFGPRGMGVVVVLLGSGAALAALSLRRPYVELFRSRLHDEDVQHLFDFPDLDVDSLAALISRLGSRDDDEVLAAIDLLESDGQIEALPSLILYHPSDRIVLRALRVFVEHDESEVVSALERRSSDASPALRAALLSARTTLAPGDLDLTDYLDAEPPVVRATAGLHLAALDRRHVQALEELDRLVSEGSTAERRALAFALGSVDSNEHVRYLVEMLDAEAIEVQRAAIAALTRIGDRACLRSLRDRLDDRRLRNDIFEAFASIGERALAFLVESLGDSDLPSPVRRRIPQAIGHFDATEPAARLARRLPQEEDRAIRAGLVEQLERLQFIHGALDLPAEALREALDDYLERAYRLAHWQHRTAALSDGDPDEPTSYQLLLQLLDDRRERAIDRCLRLIGLLYPNRDVDRARRGLQSGDRIKRASGRELLESLLPPDLQPAVLELLEHAGEPTDAPSPPEDVYEPGSLSDEELFAALLESRSPEIAILAAEYAAAAGVHAALGPLERATDWMDDETEEYVDYARARLEYDTGSGDVSEPVGSVS
ncbi:MAG: HEAT repeat domain-containing protein [Bradymonadaceae bacterium]